MAGRRHKLTNRQERFVAEYLIDLNACRAAIRAGYSAKTASRIGPELLGKTWVAAAIEVGKRQQLDRVGITADDIVRELKAVAMPAPGSNEHIRTSDKVAALRELALHLPGFRAPTRVAPTDPTGTREYEALTDEERAVRMSQILDRIQQRKEGAN